ncbi:hypothetical protein [Alkalibacillus haloalkaliphilus]|uniref:hypothetical protein n=1 Tax=Alkalibacillus haloalkaliphilus TaxID=94136 RepID=UPI002935D26D|nr:hypothetical protein [Alkalibacillus haloalkaliphilus]MDV2581279.1 hypothetical protein [Alkalibacillus haloalkaliphilus]
MKKIIIMSFMIISIFILLTNMVSGQSWSYFSDHVSTSGALTVEWEIIEPEPNQCFVDLEVDNQLSSEVNLEMDYDFPSSGNVIPEEYFSDSQYIGSNSSIVYNLNLVQQNNDHCEPFQENNQLTIDFDVFIGGEQHDSISEQEINFTKGHIHYVYLTITDEGLELEQSPSPMSD